MIISDKSAIEKLNSPKNLINSLKNSSKNNAMSLFIGNKINEVIKPKEQMTVPFNPFISIKQEEVKEKEESPRLDNLIENNETQVKLSLAHDEALKLVNNSISLLSSKLDDIRADKLPSVITAAGKIVESIRKERSENSRTSKDREVHHHFYMPQQRKLEDYEVVEGITL